ncbi:flagellar motor protein MotB [Agaribacterium haliotis]|uniref:flagellar motor protein MotB n=1 Tax=Agaribacterium haliotis TaxID=2013869 RepID=UPI001EFCB572|nr:flagellar motor protein MotB [Agaribacterium haliotis]
MSHRRLLSRARKGEHHARSVGHERWLISYSDFITLLFAFFVVMYSVSQVHEEKYRTLSETLSAAFHSQQDLPQQQNQQQKKQQTLAELEQLAGQLQRELSGFPIAGKVSLGANENWLELSLSSELIFASGAAQPSNEALALFAALASQLAPYQNEIQVSGHTDSVPINNNRYANNWELSSARALAVVKALSEQGVDSQRLAAVAFAEHRPVASNETEQGRRQNRRVVLRVASSALKAPETKPEQALEQLQLADEPSTDIRSEQQALQNAAAPQSERSNASAEGEASIEPIRLKGGDLLFSSDPNLPRLRAIEQE